MNVSVCPPIWRVSCCPGGRDNNAPHCEHKSEKQSKRRGETSAHLEARTSVSLTRWMLSVPTRQTRERAQATHKRMPQEIQGLRVIPFSRFS